MARDGDDVLALTRLLRRAWRAAARSLATTLTKQPVLTGGDAARVDDLWQVEVEDKLLAYVGDVYRTAADEVRRASPVAEVPLVDVDPLVEAHLSEVRGRLHGIADDVWAGVRGALVAGYRNGDHPSLVAARIQASTGITPGRALTVARTEVHAAREAGSYAQAAGLAAALGGGVTKTWLATEDDRTRSSHRLVDGVTVDLDQPFTVGGVPVRFPGDPAAPPEERLNCRCTVLYDFVDVDELVAAGTWKPRLHPRGRDGRFIEKGGIAELLSVDSPTEKQLHRSLEELDDDQDTWRRLTPEQQRYLRDRVERSPTGSATREYGRTVLEKLAGGSRELPAEAAYNEPLDVDGKPLTGTPAAIVRSNLAEAAARPDDFDDSPDVVHEGPAAFYVALASSNFTPGNSDVAAWNGAQTYQSKLVKAWNTALRAGKPPSDLTRKERGRVADAQRALDRLLEDNTLGRGIRVYRGLRGVDPAFLARLTPGSIIDDQAYVSTSTDRQLAQDFAEGDDGVLFDIELPAGTHAVAPTQWTTRYLREREVTLPRSSRFEVLEEPRRDDSGRLVVRLRALLTSSDITAAAKAGGKWKPHQHPRGKNGKFIKKGDVASFLSATKPTPMHLAKAASALDEKTWGNLTDEQKQHFVDQAAKLAEGGLTSKYVTNVLTKLESPKTTKKTPTVGKSTKVTTTLVWGKHEDGAVILVDGQGSRVRWDSAKKKYVKEFESPAGSGTWHTVEEYTKKGLYEDYKGIEDLWHEPGEGDSPEVVDVPEVLPPPPPPPTPASSTSGLPAVAGVNDPMNEHGHAKTGYAADGIVMQLTQAATRPADFDDSPDVVHEGTSAFYVALASSNFTKGDSSAPGWKGTRAYQSMVAEAWNRSLRTGKPITGVTPQQKAWVEEAQPHLDKLLAENTLKRGVRVYRGLKNMDDEFMAKLTPGNVIDDKGYVSTSTDRKLAEGFAGGGVLMDIELPAGTHGVAPTQWTTRFLEEYEITLPRNSRFEVLEAPTKDVYGRTIVKLRALLDDEPSAAPATHVEPQKPEESAKPQALTYEDSTKLTAEVVLPNDTVVAYSPDGLRRLRWNSVLFKYAVDARDSLTSSWSKTPSDTIMMYKAGKVVRDEGWTVPQDLIDAHDLKSATPTPAAFLAEVEVFDPNTHVVTPGVFARRSDGKTRMMYDPDAQVVTLQWKDATSGEWTHLGQFAYYGGALPHDVVQELQVGMWLAVNPAQVDLQELDTDYLHGNLEPGVYAEKLFQAVDNGQLTAQQAVAKLDAEAWNALEDDDKSAVQELVQYDPAALAHLTSLDAFPEPTPAQAIGAHTLALADFAANLDSYAHDDVIAISEDGLDRLTWHEPHHAVIVSHRGSPDGDWGVVSTVYLDYNEDVEGQLYAGGLAAVTWLDPQSPSGEKLLALGGSKKKSPTMTAADAQKVLAHTFPKHQVIAVSSDGLRRLRARLKPGSSFLEDRWDPTSGWVFNGFVDQNETANLLTSGDWKPTELVAEKVGLNVGIPTTKSSHKLFYPVNAVAAYKHPKTSTLTYILPSDDIISVDADGRVYADSYGSASILAGLGWTPVSMIDIAELGTPASKSSVTPDDLKKLLQLPHISNQVVAVSPDGKERVRVFAYTGGDVVYMNDHMTAAGAWIPTKPLSNGEVTSRVLENGWQVPQGLLVVNNFPGSGPTTAQDPNLFTPPNTQASYEKSGALATLHVTSSGIYSTTSTGVTYKSHFTSAKQLEQNGWVKVDLKTPKGISGHVSASDAAKIVQSTYVSGQVVAVSSDGQTRVRYFTSPNVTSFVVDERIDGVWKGKNEVSVDGVKALLVDEGWSVPKSVADLHGVSGPTVSGDNDVFKPVAVQATYQHKNVQNIIYETPNGFVLVDAEGLVTSATGTGLTQAGWVKVPDGVVPKIPESGLLGKIVSLAYAIGNADLLPHNGVVAVASDGSSKITWNAEEESIIVWSKSSPTEWNVSDFFSVDDDDLDEYVETLSTNKTWLSPATAAAQALLESKPAAPTPVKYAAPAMTPHKKKLVKDFFKGKETGWYSKSEKIYETLLQAQQEPWAAGFTQAQLLEALDTQLKKTGAPFATKIEKWLATSTGYQKSKILTAKYGSPGSAAPPVAEAGIADIPPSTKTEIFQKFKALPGTTVASDPNNVYAASQQVAAHTGYTPLQVLQVVDDHTATKIGKPNAFLYEKKVVDWLGSSKGVAEGVQKQVYQPGKPDTPKFNKHVDPANIPTFDASSHYSYETVSVSQAGVLQGEAVAASPAGAWTVAQRAGLRAYTGGIYGAINSYLQGKVTKIPDTTRTHMLNSQLGMRPSTKPMLLHRRTGLDGVAHATSFLDLQNKVGSTWRNDGFFSTSANGYSSAGSGSVVIEVEAPPGTPMAWLKPISMYEAEDEMLLAAGLSYRIISVAKDTFDVKVRVRVVPS